MSICLTKTEIIAGSVDGTVRTFDIRTGRYVSFENGGIQTLELNGLADVPSMYIHIQL